MDSEFSSSDAEAYERKLIQLKNMQNLD